MRRLASLVLLVTPMFAAVDGTVTNATTGKAAAGVSVALVQPGQGGMKTLAKTTSGADGKFEFSQTLTGPGLIQATFDDVTYSKIIMPGTPTTGLKVDVFDATKKPIAQVAQHMILVQPTGTDLTVNETLLYQDDSKVTYSDHANGTVHFYVPPGLKDDIKVTVNAPGGMPVQRAAEKTKVANVYKVDTPIKPGETRVDLAYTITASNPAVLEGKILHKEGKTRLVTPNGVSLKGDNIQEVGKEPQTQASIYDITGQTYKVEVSGIGSLQPPDTAPDEDTGAPKIEQVPPHIYNKIYWIVALAFAILGLGTYLLARHAPPPALKK